MRANNKCIVCGSDDALNSIDVVMTDADGISFECNHHHINNAPYVSICNVCRWEIIEGSIGLEVNLEVKKLNIDKRAQ